MAIHNILTQIYYSMYSEIGLLMSYKLAGKRVRLKVFYDAYAASTHSHTTVATPCSRTGSKDAQES